MAKDKDKDAAAVKIQALARGRRDRKKVDGLLQGLIESLMASKEGKKKSGKKSKSKPKTKKKEKKEKKKSAWCCKGDVSAVEEEIIEVVEIVTVVDSKPETTPKESTAKTSVPAKGTAAPKARTPKVSEFDRYNQQQKQEQAARAMARPPGLKPTKSWREPPSGGKAARPEWMEKAKSFRDASEKSAASSTAAASKGPVDPRKPPPPKPQGKHKSALVNRYLEAAARQNEGEKKNEDEASKIIETRNLEEEKAKKEEEDAKREEEEKAKAAEIEADRAKNAGKKKWKGKTTAYQNHPPNVPKPWEKKAKQPPGSEVPSGSSDADVAAKPREPVPEGGDAKDKVASLNDNLMNKTSETTTGTMTMSTLSPPSGYDESQGLPLWWMQLVPHNTNHKGNTGSAKGKNKVIYKIDKNHPPAKRAKLQAISEGDEPEAPKTTSNRSAPASSSRKKKSGIFAKWFSRPRRRSMGEF